MNSLLKKKTKEEEKEEFDKLYNLLFSLSTKGTNKNISRPPPPLLSDSSSNDSLSFSDSPSTYSEDSEKSEELDEFSKMKNDILANFTKKDITNNKELEKIPIKIEINVFDKVENNIIEEVIKIDKQICKACDRIYQSQSCLDAHLDFSEVCRKWYTLLSNHVDQIELSSPIHLLVDNWLSSVITGDKPHKCKYCNSTFVSRGNHHKHYYTANACNRLAYYEFKKLIQSI